METVIWLTEVAPNAGRSAKVVLDHLTSANHAVNPALMRLALKPVLKMVMGHWRHGFEELARLLGEQGDPAVPQAVASPLPQHARA